MFCMKCGKEIPDDATFCYACGVKVVLPEKTIPNEVDVACQSQENKSVIAYSSEPSKDSLNQEAAHHEENSEGLLKNTESIESSGPDKKRVKKSVIVIIGIAAVLVAVLILIGILVGVKARKTLSFSNSNTSDAEEYVPYIDVDSLGFAGQNTSKEAMIALGNQYIEDSTGINLGTITLTKDQELWGSTFSGLIMWFIYDNSVERVVGDHWMFADEQIVSVKNGFSDIAEANVDPRIVRYRNGEKATSDITNLVWKYNGGYIILAVEEDGTDNWQNWKVMMRTTIEEASQINYYSDSIRFESENSNSAIQNEKYIDESQEQNLVIQNSELKEDVIKDEDKDIPFTEGGLPESVFERIKGHYVDGTGFSIDIESPTSITKSYGSDKYRNQIICGYYELARNCFYIYVEDTEYSDKHVYMYTEEEIPKLYGSIESSWEPRFDDYYECYSKDEKDHAITKNIDIDALNETISNQKVTIRDLNVQGYTLSLYLDHTSPGVSLPYKLYEFENYGCYAVVYSYCPEKSGPNYSEPNADERVYLIIDSDNIEDPAIYDTYFNLLGID